MKRLIYKFLGGIIFISIVLLMVASFAHKEGEAEYEIIVDEPVPLAGAIPIEDERLKHRNLSSISQKGAQNQAPKSGQKRKYV